ncbi:hypothetical protein [Pseudomonas sp. KCA11]|nr:hypothetical protein [Pseudomonas sp. KCA11]
MNADEPGVWLDEKELYVPTIPLEHMYLDGCDGMVRGADVMNTPA